MLFFNFAFAFFDIHNINLLFYYSIIISIRCQVFFYLFISILSIFYKDLILSICKKRHSIVPCRSADYLLITIYPSVPVTVTVVLPGVTAIVPSALVVNVAAGTVIAP